MNIQFRRNWVSILITTFQREDYVLEAVKSVHNQTYRPIELIVIDDGSSDGTDELLSNWSASLKKEDNFEFHYHFQENQGAPTARNSALKRCTGEFIQFLDSDDFLDPLKIQLQVELLRKFPQCQAVWNPLQKFYDDPEASTVQNVLDYEKSKASAYVRPRTENLFVPQFLPSSSLLCRHLLVEAGPWKKTLKRWQDLEYQVRLAYNLKEYIVVEPALYYFRQHDSVRINAQFSQKKGISAGLETLSVIESTMKELNHSNADMNLELSKFYVSIATLAAEFQSTNQIKCAIEGATRYRSGVTFRLRMKAFYALSKLLGGRTANRLAQLYLNR